jgi:uncharacterized membrane protein
MNKIVISMLMVVGLVSVACAWDQVNTSVDGINVKGGSLAIDGVKYTGTAAQLNAAAGGVSTNATVTKSVAAITATAAVTRQTFVPALSMADGTTNTVAFMTNATVAVTVVNGGVVLTNLVLNVDP